MSENSKMSTQTVVVVDPNPQYIPVKNVGMDGYKLTFELRNVPVQFANAIRRILLNEMPVVEVSDVVIHENTTLVPHEMLKLRTELLPINVRPTEEDLIRSVKLTLLLNNKEGKVTTDDFQVAGARKDILMKDRDLGTPLYFLKMKKDDSVHITASLYVNSLSSHVCVSTYSYHVDPELAESDKEAFLEDNEGWDEAETVFNNFYRQRSFHKNEKGQADWFDFTVESIGLIPATELVKDALNILKKRILEWSKNEIVRESEENAYCIKSDSENHTLRGIIQAILYDSGLCDFVTSDIPHPLRTEMLIRFHTLRTPEECVSFVKNKVAEYCDACIGIL